VATFSIRGDCPKGLCSGVSVGAIVPDCGVTRIRYSISLPCGTGKIQLGVVDMLCCRGAAPHFINMPAAVDANGYVVLISSRGKRIL